jgi:endonuclease I
MHEQPTALPPTAVQALESALASLDAGRSRDYYDAEDDAAAAAAYYADTSQEQIGLLITTTHQHRPTYQPSREVYPWVDLHPDRTLRSLYTGQTYDPGEVIRADIATQARRLQRAQTLAAFADTSPEVIADQLDTTLPYNCEHVVPQSWFGKAEPMRGDLHHLFACESRCNSFRGNIPYAEFADWPAPPPQQTHETPLEAVVRTDCGKRDTAAFEPAHGKGPVARATLYVALRYPGVINPEECPAERFHDLLHWHQNEPVTTWERHRNAAIHERQGNRNPFIDHPALAYDLLDTLTAPLGSG